MAPTYDHSAGEVTMGRSVGLAGQLDLLPCPAPGQTRGPVSGKKTGTGEMAQQGKARTTIPEDLISAS